MGIFGITLAFLTIVALIGGLLETFSPGLFSESFKKNMSALTIGSLGIIISTILLMIFLKARNREGFEDSNPTTRWTTLVTSFRIPEICKVYSEMYEKIMLVEKGAAPEPIKTDAQAREATDRVFASTMKVAPVSCALFEEVDSQKGSLDSFFQSIQKLPDNFLVQVVETAIACRALLMDQYQKVLDAEQRQKEGFQDFQICNEQAAQERKAMQEKKVVKEEAQECLLPEEIPTEKKESMIQKKLDSLEKTYKNYLQGSPMKDSLEQILKDTAYYKGELDKKKNDAEETSNKYNFR